MATAFVLPDGAPDFLCPERIDWGADGVPLNPNVNQDSAATVAVRDVRLAACDPCVKSLVDGPGAVVGCRLIEHGSACAYKTALNGPAGGCPLGLWSE